MDKKFYINGMYNRTSYRISSSDFIFILPKLITTGKFKSAINSNRWRQINNNYIYIEVFMYKNELRRFLAENNIKILTEQDRDIFNEGGSEIERVVYL